MIKDSETAREMQAMRKTKYHGFADSKVARRAQAKSVASRKANREKKKAKLNVDTKDELLQNKESRTL